MKLTKLRGPCQDGKTCPTIYATDRGTLIVQGYAVEDPIALAALRLPEGEMAVEVPLTLLPEVTDAGH